MAEKQPEEVRSEIKSLLRNAEKEERALQIQKSVLIRQFARTRKDPVGKRGRKRRRSQKMVVFKKIQATYELIVKQKTLINDLYTKLREVEKQLGPPKIPIWANKRLKLMIRPAVPHDTEAIADILSRAILAGDVRLDSVWMRFEGKKFVDKHIRADKLFVFENLKKHEIVGFIIIAYKNKPKQQFEFAYTYTMGYYKAKHLLEKFCAIVLDSTRTRWVIMDWRFSIAKNTHRLTEPMTTFLKDKLHCRIIKAKGSDIQFRSIKATHAELDNYVAQMHSEGWRKSRSTEQEET